MIRWLKAVRPPAFIFIQLPILLGASLYGRLGAHFNSESYVLSVVYGFLLQALIMLCNDYSDFETDRLNHTSTVFSGGSRVLASDQATLAEYKFGIVVVATFFGLYVALWSFCFRSLLPLYFALSSLLLIWFYHFGPLRLSYRGFGEFLQVFAMGVILPYFSFVLQGEAAFPWHELYPLWLSLLAAVCATTFPDYPSDFMSKKNTLAVRFGPRFAQWLTLLLMLICLSLNHDSASLSRGPFDKILKISAFGSVVVYILVIEAKPHQRLMNIKVLCPLLFNSSLFLAVILNSWII